MNRARRGQDLYPGSEDMDAFLDLLKETVAMFNLKVSSYCLMPTHHLLVQTPDGNLARCMRHLNGIYTQRYNVLNKCDGTLFRGRYKSILVDADSYLLELVRYSTATHCGPGSSKNWTGMFGAAASATFLMTRTGNGCTRSLYWGWWQKTEQFR